MSANVFDLLEQVRNDSDSLCEKFGQYQDNPERHKSATEALALARSLVENITALVEYEEST